MQHDGWIKMHRRLLEWEWYADIKMVRLFLHLLLRASYAPARERGVEVERGELRTSRPELARETGLTEREVRTCLSRLMDSGEIALRSTKQGSVISVLNYAKYQGVEEENQRPTERPTKRPTETADAQLIPEGSDQRNDQRGVRQTTNGTTNYIRRNKENNKYLVDGARTREEFLRDFFDERRTATLESLCMQLNLELPQLRKLAKEVLTEWEDKEHEHRDARDAENHLRDHIRIKIAKQRRKPQERQARRDPQGINTRWAGFAPMPTE